MLKKILKMLISLLKFTLTQVTQGIMTTIIILLIIVGGGFYLLNENKGEEKVVKDNSYLELNFSNGMVEKNQASIFDFKDSLRLYPVLEGIKKAKIDKKIKGIYIDIDEVALSSNQIEEIGGALEDFKTSGKKVYAFTRALYNQNYSLGLYADNIDMPPIQSAPVTINGYHREFNYFKGLADFIGVKFNVIHIGDYKAFGEQYSRGNMSEQFREDLKRVYDKIYDMRISNISKKRKLNKELVNKEILEGKLTMTTPNNMKELGMIDELDYKSEFLKKNNIKERIDIIDYLTTIKTEKVKEKIAIIYATGDIVGKAKRSRDNINIEDMIKNIRKATEDKSIKGIVMRVNSPGGAALAAEIIHHELSKVEKPIYVSMGGVAASGGYYISAGADKIFATESTITGSIGVVSLIPNISELTKNLKVNVETLEKGKFSGIGSLTTEMTSEEILKIRDSSKGIYDEFKERVSKGRNISLDDLEKIAGGRIWLGEEGINNKLVDEIGGLEDTIDSLANKLKLNKYEVVEISEEKNMIEELIGIKSSYKKVQIKLENLLEAPIKTTLKSTSEYEIRTPLVLMPYDFN